MPPCHRRCLVALVALVLLLAPGVAIAQTGTIPEDGADVSTTPPVPLDDGETTTSPGSTRTAELPDTGSDPRLLLLAGGALMLLGFGLRLRTVDAELY